MKINYTKLATVVNVPVRLAMGFGVGNFVRIVTKNVTKDMSKPKKVAACIGAFCTAWAVGHAVDSWCDKAVTTLVNRDDFLKTVKEDLDFEE